MSPFINQLSHTTATVAIGYSSGLLDTGKTQSFVFVQRENMAVNSRVNQALNTVRNSEPEDVPEEAKAIVERAIAALWRLLQANPNYVLNKDEFALFTYARGRYTKDADALIAKRAVARYWDSASGSDGASGSK